MNNLNQTKTQRNELYWIFWHFCPILTSTSSIDGTLDSNLKQKACLSWEVCLSHLVAQLVKNLPAMWKTRVRSLGQEDALEKAMTTHSSILAWRIPWTEEPGRIQSCGLKRVWHGWATLSPRRKLASAYSVLSDCAPCGKTKKWDTGPASEVLSMNEEIFPV